jgi:signal peptidase I
VADRVAVRGALRELTELVLFASLLIVFFKTFVAQQFAIPSASMRETLMIGDHLLVNKFIFARPQWDWEARAFPMAPVHRGDLVVFRYPLDRSQDFVKRCVALEGDRVEMKDKHLFVNGARVTGAFEHHILAPGGQPVAGPWTPGRPVGDPDPARDDYGPVVVPEGCVLALGDNRDRSADGRAWGFLPVDHLRGRPFIVWWSFREGGDDDTNARTFREPVDLLENAADTLIHFPTWTRWKRTGTIPR